VLVLVRVRVRVRVRVGRADGEGRSRRGRPHPLQHLKVSTLVPAVAVGVDEPKVMGARREGERKLHVLDGGAERAVDLPAVDAPLRLIESVGARVQADEHLHLLLVALLQRRLFGRGNGRGCGDRRGLRSGLRSGLRGGLRLFRHRVVVLIVLVFSRLEAGLDSGKDSGRRAGRRGGDDTGSGSGGGERCGHGRGGLGGVGGGTAGGWVGGGRAGREGSSGRHAGGGGGVVIAAVVVAAVVVIAVAWSVSGAGSIRAVVVIVLFVVLTRYNELRRPACPSHLTHILATRDQHTVLQHRPPAAVPTVAVCVLKLDRVLACSQRHRLHVVAEVCVRSVALTAVDAPEDLRAPALGDNADHGARGQGGGCHRWCGGWERAGLPRRRVGGRGGMWGTQ